MEKKERNFQTRTSASAQGTMASAPSQMAPASVQPQGDVIDLQELFWVLVDKWKVIFLAMLLGAFVFGLYHTFLMKPSYQADASIFITSNESVISVADLQISSELTQDYSNIIKSRNVLKQVIKRSGSESGLQTAVPACYCQQSAGFAYYSDQCKMWGCGTLQGYCQFTDEYRY